MKQADGAPWLRPDLFEPVRPRFRERFGYIPIVEDDAYARPTPVDDADALSKSITNLEDQPLLGWRPGDPWLTTVYEIDDVSEAVEARAKKDMREVQRKAVPRTLIVVVLVILGVLFWPEDRSVQVLILLGTFLAFGPLWSQGVEALATSWFDLRRLAEQPARWRRYRAESLRFDAWSTESWSATGVGLSIVCVILFVTSMVAGRQDAFDALALDGVKVAEGEVWRLYTCTLLHANFMHIYFNLMVAMSLSLQARSLVSESRVLLTFLVSALAGSAASVLLTDGRSVGASGGILGWGGLLAGIALTNPAVRRTDLLGSMVRWVFILALIGFIGSGIIDNAAHAGGFVAGFGLGILFGRQSRATPFPVGGNERGIGFWMLAIPALAGAAAMLFLLGRMIIA